MSTRWGLVALTLTGLLSSSMGCTEPSASGATPAASSSATGAPAEKTLPPPTPEQLAQLACEADDAKETAEITAGELTTLPGTPELDRSRAEVLGRARGEPVIFVREPAFAPESTLTPEQIRSRATFEKEPHGIRITRLKQRHKTDRAALRKMLLREGYVYSADPLDALALVTDLRVIDLFDEPEIWLHRAGEIHRLIRFKPSRGDAEYRYAEGPREGKSVDLLWADRFALSRDELNEPLHRDVIAVADEQGFDHMSVERVTTSSIVARVRYGERFVKARFVSNDASLKMQCLLEPESVREQVAAWRDAETVHRRAMAKIHEAVTLQVDDSFRFDRPEGVTTAEEDGRLRPIWHEAYRRGNAFFSHDGHSYAVYDNQGRAWPPEVCVDLVLDTFERASGSWYRPKSQPPGREIGGLDFDAYGIPNRRAVLAFEMFAKNKPELFDAKRFEGNERIPFGERSRFFAWLVEHADEVRAGDIVAIQGRKRDGLIHQHAIFVERTDPISGFAYGLADQMKRPRRRTWEGIMAEAPLRSLLYRVRPKQVIWEKITK
ncbi:MAG: hypothetical protein U0165_19050 [Polyangiaceae bacterium]